MANALVRLLAATTVTKLRNDVLNAFPGEEASRDIVSTAREFKLCSAGLDKEGCFSPVVSNRCDYIITELITGMLYPGSRGI